MFDLTIHRDNSPERFKSACKLIENTYSDAIKENVLVDVDGTTIQLYHVNGNEIKIIDDYEVGAVYVQSEIDLSGVFMK